MVGNLHQKIVRACNRSRNVHALGTVNVHGMHWWCVAIIRFEFCHCPFLIYCFDHFFGIRSSVRTMRTRCAILYCKNLENKLNNTNWDKKLTVPWARQHEYQTGSCDRDLVQSESGDWPRAARTSGSSKINKIAVFLPVIFCSCCFLIKENDTYVAIGLNITNLKCIQGSTLCTFSQA